MVNTSGGSANLNLYQAPDGSTFDESTATFCDYPEAIAAGASWSWDGRAAIEGGNEVIAYKSSVANALTITIWGMEIDK